MAARFFVVGGVDTNWSTIGNWSLTSGGAGGQAVPLATDDVTLDANSGSACVLNTSARVALTINTTNFTGTVTFSQQLSVSGSITWGTNAAFAGATTNKLRMIAAGTWQTNGVTVPQDIEIGGTTTFTCTLAAALTSTGALTLSNTTSTIFSGAFAISAASCLVSGGQTITMSGNVTITNLTDMSTATVLNGAFNWTTGGLTVTGQTTGTATIVFGGTGTWSGATSLHTNVTINTAGTLTISGTVQYATSTLTYTAGTVSVGSSVLSLLASCTLVTDGMSWANLSLAAALTVTINSPLSIAGTLTLPNAAVTFAGSAGWTCGTLTNTTITATRIYTFTAGRTYTVTVIWQTIHAALQTVRFTFTASSSCNFVLGPGASQDVGFVDPTNMDASTGQKIFSYHGVISSSPNWANDRPPNVSIAWPTSQVGI